MKKLILFCLGILNLFSLLNAQILSKDYFFNDYVSRTWNSEDGIPGNSITDICQDKDGYIYFGTYGGLVRFDGLQFVTINKLYDEKYDFFSARSILQDSRENIWVGSNDQGAYCIKKNGEVEIFSVENGLPNNSVRAFCEDNYGNVWIGTASGIAVVSTDFKIVKLSGFEKIPQNNNFIVSQLFCDSAGRIWIVTRTEKGLIIYSDKEFSIYEGIRSFENPIVTSMTQDSSGAYWFGIAPYYAVKKIADNEQIVELGNGDQKGAIVTCIYQDSAKNVWFGLDNGITILHDGILSYFYKENGLADRSIVKIIEDREKNIWIATDHGGLQKISYGKFQTTEMQTTVNAIAQDLFRKCVWLAGDDGLYCYKNNVFVENEITKFCKNTRIRHVSVTESGELIISTYEKLGQICVDKNGNIRTWTKQKDGICGDRVRVAQRMKNGDLYIGTTTGLSIVDGKTGKITNITKADGLANDYIMCLFQEEESERIWVGTDGGGVFILEGRKVMKSYTKEDKLAGNVIFKISSLRKGEIWVCTGTGVSCINGDEIFNLDASNGFGSDGIFQLISDFSGKVWGTSNRGIFYVKMDDIEKLLNGQKSVLSLKYYNRLDGITSSGITSTSLSMKDDLGRIWFTLIDGFTIFDPIRNASNDYAPVVKIEDVFVDNEKVDISKGVVVLSPRTKRVAIKYSGITFVSSEQVLFKTKLEGFENTFTDWTGIRQASYTNLQPGTYKFYVVAQNGDEVLCKTSANIILIKKPYLWQRPWFIVLCIFAVILCVFIYVYRKVQRLRREKEKAEKLSVEVIQALVGTIEAKDKYTKGHSNRVADYSKQLAVLLGESKEVQKNVYYAALLHDIGKIGVPDTIINKPSKLSPDEYDIVKTHPHIGSQILSSLSTMKEIVVGVRGHHERFDGSGYPDKKTGKDIPVIARIIAVADAYDAMTSNRSYRRYLDQDRVRSEIEKNKGNQFDPEIADKMIEIIDKDTDYKLHE